MSIPAVRYRIRPMTEDDLPGVMEIERASFPSAWPESAYRKELTNRLARYVVAVEAEQRAEASPGRRRLWGSIARALGRDGNKAAAPTGRIIGFAGLWLMVDEAHIVTLAVREGNRRQGVAQALALRAIDLARESDQRRVTLEVRASNTAAQALYSKLGFQRAGVRRRYYTDNQEDAVIMTTPDLDSPEYRALLASISGGRR